MKPRHIHRYSIAGSVATDLERVFTLRCNLCGREKTQKRKMPSRSHTNAPGSTAAKKKGGDKPRTRIKPVSDKQKVRNAEYSKLRRAFLEERKTCEVEGCKNPSTEVHHKSRRHGKFFLDTSSWLAACSHCHRRIEDNPAWSKAMGYLQYHFS